jgi:hypothetical protein
MNRLVFRGRIRVGCENGWAARWALSATLTIVGVVGGCGGGVEPAPSPPEKAKPAPGGTVEASFRRDVVPLFDASCAFAACHSPDSYIPLTLGPSTLASTSPEHVYRALTASSPYVYAVPLVVPGYPERSLLYRKLTGDFGGLACNGPGFGCGSQMPRPRYPPVPPVSEAQIAAVADWITAGAPDN